jgi:hypothetical protein
MLGVDLRHEPRQYLTGSDRRDHQQHVDEAEQH